MAQRVRLRHRLEFLAFRGVLGALRVLPERWALGIGATVGWLVGSVARVRRDVTDANLARAFPDRDRRWRDRVARASYRNLGREAVATFLFAGDPPERVLERTRDARGVEEMLAAARAGKGLLLVTGHLGNWEIAAGAAAARGAPMAAVTTRQANRLFDDALVDARARLGIATIRRGNARREVIEALRGGGVVGVVADQDARERGVFVDFLGTPASTARGPALFALRTGAPVFLGLCLAVPGVPGSYRCELEEIRFERTGNLGEDVRRLTAAHAAALGERVRREPEQYFWQHRRWRTPPPAPGV